MQTAAPYILAAVFAGLALTLLALESRRRRSPAERFRGHKKSSCDKVTALAAQIRCDNEVYRAAAARNVTGSNDKVDLPFLAKVRATDAYGAVREKVKEQVAMWEKILLYINATVKKYREATSGPQRDLVGDFEPDAFKDV